METNFIQAVIERADDGGFTAYSDSVPGVYANGLSEEEVRTEFLDMMKEQADFVAERTGERPSWADAEVQFTFDISALFDAFPFLNASAFAEWIGINPSLMRRYKSGLSKPTGKTREVIRNGFRSMADRLQHVYV